MSEENKNEAASSLNVNDLKNLLTIVDIASKRGAFTPKEFGPIGEVYNRVDAFLTAATAKTEEESNPITSETVEE